MSYLGPIPIDQSPTAPKKGLTVGNNNCDLNGGDEVVLQKAIDSGAKIIELKNGTFRLNAPVVSAAPDVTIWGHPGVVLIPSTNASFGLFNLTGARARIENLYVRIERPVAGQQVVQLQGDLSESVRCVYEQVAAGDPANSTHVLSFGNVDNVTRTLGGLALHNTFIPHIGSVCLQALFQDGTRWHGNKFGAASPGVRRDCRAVFATNSCQQQSLIGNVIEYLGTVSQSMDGIWRERPNAVVGGGNVFGGNTIRSCRFGTSGIFFNGSTGWSICGNTFAEISELGDYFFALDEFAGTTREASGIAFAGNVWKGVGKAGVAGALKYLKCNRVSMTGDQFLDVPQAQILLTTSNIAAGAANPANTMYALKWSGLLCVATGGIPRMVTPSTGLAANGWSASDIALHGFSGGAGTRFWSTAGLSVAFNSVDLWES